MKGLVTFTNSPTEQTTAVTDIILAIMAGAVAAYLPQIGRHQPWKVSLWVWALGLLAAAATLGAVGHGLKLSDKTSSLIWRALFLSLGLLVAVFMTAAVYDIWGIMFARWALPLTISLGLLFFCSTLIWPHTFLGFIIYEGAAMGIAMMGYLWLAVTGQLNGAWLMAGGIFVTLVAAGVQSGRLISFTVIWQFDHNGAYHLLQMVGLGLIAAGLRAAFVA